MEIITSSEEFAEKMIGAKIEWGKIGAGNLNSHIAPLAERILGKSQLSHARLERPGLWKYLFISEYSQESQYDIIIESIKKGAKIPDGTLCLADSGSKFHGFKGRKWAAMSGNIHLTAYLRPNREIKDFGAGFMILSAVSALKTLDEFKEISGLPKIKWVNDVLIGGSKICGVLAYSQAQGAKTTGAALGIGMNIESSPEFTPDRFVPKAAKLHDFVAPGPFNGQGQAFRILIDKLEKYYGVLLSGGYSRLLDIYRERSSIIGRRCRLWGEAPNEGELAKEGAVEKIGDSLELYFKGEARPYYKGRIEALE